MARHVAFLRGINLGRVRRVTKEELCSCFEAIGLANAVTFRASGNVIFDAPAEPLAKLTARVERSLTEGLGYQVTAFLRSGAEVRAMAASEPFDRGSVESSKGKLQVALLGGPPAKGVRAQVLGMGTDSDRLAFGKRELYWLPSGGTQGSPLDLRGMEKLLGPWTMRTMGTIEQIAVKHLGANSVADA